ncbi:MAG: hypothetical protein ACRDTZ_12970 [Pseudonocardiaceae bacterium]
MLMGVGGALAVAALVLSVLATIGYLKAGSPITMVVLGVIPIIVSPLIVLVIFWLLATLRMRRVERNHPKQLPDSELRPSGGLVKAGSVVVPVPLVEVNRTILRTVSDHDQARILRSDDRRLLIGMRPTMKSWGEFVTVEMREEPAGTHLTVTSWPVLRTTLFDWGKNSANIRWLLSLQEVADRM